MVYCRQEADMSILSRESRSGKNVSKPVSIAIKFSTLSSCLYIFTPHPAPPLSLSLYLSLSFSLPLSLSLSFTHTFHKVGEVTPTVWTYAGCHQILCCMDTADIDSRTDHIHSTTLRIAHKTGLIMLLS